MAKKLILLASLALALTGCSGRSENTSTRRGSQQPNAGGSQTSQPLATPSPQPTQDPVPVVQKLTADLGTALSQGNADALSEYLSDGYLHINDNGQLVTKPELIAGVREGSVRFNSVNIQEVNVRLYGDAAVVTANFIGANAAGGSRSSVEDRVTLVAAREGDTWRFVSGQTTPIHAVPQGGNTKSGASGGTSQSGTTGIQSGKGQSQTGTQSGSKGPGQ
ncbi:MAG TPA: nuclear transport factor 2 family protein [Pyrinomonadaceae bacterium]|nr:nuclear transport factor 2 family protein [Pyrinomonadaceae bacterium]